MNLSTQAALQQLQRYSGDAAAAKIRVEATESGVDIRRDDERICFHHSFLTGPFARRASQSNQALLKACHNKQGNIKSLLDMTAGWGMDSLSLARHGKQVVLLEQNPLVCAIVAYSLACLRAQPASNGPGERMSLHRAHAFEYLQTCSGEFDCIYLDPMFPAHKSSAKPAKALQILQSLSVNLDIEDCFRLALRSARNRVVVKRPAKAAALDESKPDMVYREKTVRFDVYLTS